MSFMPIIIKAVGMNGYYYYNNIFLYKEWIHLLHNFEVCEEKQ